MPFATLASLQEQVEKICRIVEANDLIRLSQTYSPPLISVNVEPIYWRRYDYCAAVLRIYATFERFIIEISQKWLDFMSENQFPLISDSDKFLERYQMGVGDILRRSNENRFSHVNLKTLVAGLVKLQENDRLAGMGTDALFASTPNLKLVDIISLLGIMEMDNSAGWIENFPLLVRLKDSSGKGVEEFLKELVDRRNEAAHGNKMPEDIWGSKLIQESAYYVEAIAIAVAEFVGFQMIKNAEGRGPVRFPELGFIGVVKEVFKVPSAFVVNARTVGLWTGMRVAVVSKNRCYLDRINDLSLDGEKATAWLPRNNEEVGIKIRDLPGKKFKIYGVDGLNWL